MWKKLSIKKQLILILLIPFLGIIYITVSNINFSITKYKGINQSLENVNNIDILSKGITLIGNERGLTIFSSFDSSKNKIFQESKQATNDWLMASDIKDSVISENFKKLKSSIELQQERIKDNIETPITSFVQYSEINESLLDLIEREIVNCKSANIAFLANNYLNFVLLKRAALLRRGVVLQTLIDKKNNGILLEYYYDAKAYESKIDFRLKHSDLKDVNNDLIQLMNSKALATFNVDSYNVIENNLRISPNLWWSKTNKIIDKINVLEEKNLKYIEEYAAKEKDAALKNVIELITLLGLFLLVTIILVYKLIHNLSSSLESISIAIKKISLGKNISSPDFSGSLELKDISQSFNHLLVGMNEQISLSSKISSGDYGTTITVRSEHDTLNKSMNAMSQELDRLHDESVAINKIKENISEVNKSILVSKNLNEFGQNICSTIVKITAGCQASFYVLNDGENQNLLNKIGGYAEDQSTPNSIKIGEGLVGEVAKINQQKCFNNLTNAYSYISSSLGKSACFNVLITPISYKNKVIGVIEIGSLENFNEDHENFLMTLSDSIGSAIEVHIRNEELKESVNEINRKNNILQVQEEELRQSNEELNKQAMLLQQSEEELRNQAAELEQTNAYLEEKGRELENKNHEINIKNDELVVAQEELNLKADEIAKSSKYKSEFLANMSHELRTPLNSILILSDLLKDNTAGNLTDAQIDNLSVINSSGKDLLNLITDILDISKIEAGKIEVYPEESIVERLYADMEGVFGAQMKKKNIDFSVNISEDCPKELFTDIGKLEQILKNFLSNANKFTPENGKVSLSFTSGAGKDDFNTPSLATLASHEILSIHIKDNGIGISEENQKKLFQSFQQADSSTSRRYGGTGLGLYISKELAHLLGGEVSFESKLNEGSVFSVYIPTILKVEHSQTENTIASIENKNVETAVAAKPIEPTLDLSENLNDDRSQVTIDDKTILIIEDDASFAEVLFQVAHDNGFKAIVAYQGETGFQYAKKYKPKAIILDMKLPGIDGWTVLKWLKEDKELQHIPVHVMSGMNREKLAKEMGAFDFMVKPITTEKLKSAFAAIDVQINNIYKKVLILEDDINLNHSIKELVHSSDRNVICFQAHTFNEAEMILKNEEIDCAIMDIGLPDSKNVKNISTLRRISKNKDISIIVNTGKTLSDEEELELQNSADRIVIKTHNATERLKDELVLFLDKIETLNPREYKSAPNILGGEVLKDKNILIVDDDIRNIYALSSALTTRGANILTAFNGLEALEMVEKHPEINIVLMDIMMPEMDGFEATKKIRENSKWKNLPIIALTAKAMKSDREEILNAGASDYQSKPIDIQQLISLISIWIYK